MERLTCVLGRRSVRKYTDEPVSKEQEELLLSAGFSAPSARNARPWEFIVVRDRGRLAELSTVRQYWGMLKNAALSIVVCANLRDYPGTHKDFFIQDCAAATQNILVAAEGIGLGAVWLGCYPTEEGPAGVRRILGVPEDIIPFSVISIGHPAEHAKPHPEIAADRVHHEQY